MRKLFAVVLALFLSVSFQQPFAKAASASDESVFQPADLFVNALDSLTQSVTDPEQPAETEGPVFLSALTDWTRQLDLRKSDYRIELEANGEVKTASVRSGRSLTLIDLPGFGTVQFSEGKIVLKQENGTTVIDLSSLKSLLNVQNDSAGAPDRELVLSLISGALQAVIAPSVQMSYGNRGLAYHISIDNQVLLHRLADYISESMQRSDFRKLAVENGSLLRVLFPDFPDTETELLSWWEKLEARMNNAPLTAELEMDLYSDSFDFSGEIVCCGTAKYQDDTFDFNLTYSNPDSGFSLDADIHITHRQQERFALSLSILGKGSDLRLNADVSSGHSLSLVFEDSKISGSILTPSGEFEIDGRRNLLDASMDVHIRKRGSVKTIGADFSSRAGRTEMKLYGENSSAACTFSMGNRFLHFSMRKQDRYSQTADYDLLAVKTENDGFKLTLQRTGTDDYSAVSSFRCSLLAEDNRTECHYESYGRQGNDITLDYMQQQNADGYEVSSLLKYPGDLSRESSFHMISKGKDLSWELSFPQETSVINGEGTAVLDDKGMPVHAQGTFKTVYLLENRIPETRRFEYIPGKIVFEDPDAEYTIEKAKETAEELVCEFRRDGELTSTLTARLSDNDLGRMLSVTFDHSDATPEALRVIPVTKEELQPLDESGATLINAETLLLLLESLFIVSK